MTALKRLYMDRSVTTSSQTWSVRCLFRRQSVPDSQIVVSVTTDSISCTTSAREWMSNRLGIDDFHTLDDNKNPMTYIVIVFCTVFGFTIFASILIKMFQTTRCSPSDRLIWRERPVNWYFTREETSVRSTRLFRVSVEKQLSDDWFAHYNQWQRRQTAFLRRSHK